MQPHEPPGSPGREQLAAAFDQVAPRYDKGFTDLLIGRHQRDVVHRTLLRVLRPEFRVLELNCGTGLDAVVMAERCAEVVATDISPEMIRLTTARAAASPAGSRVTIRRMPMESLQSPDLRAELGRFDLIFSNFDGINCVHDISWLPAAAEALLNPGGHVILVYMNPVFLQGILFGLLRRRTRAEYSLRRLGREAVDWDFGGGNKVPTFYHPIGFVTAIFAREFELLRMQAIRLTTPPSGVYDRHQRVFDWLDDLLSLVPPFNRLGERVLLHMRRRPTVSA